MSSLQVSQVNRALRHRVDVAGKGANATRVLTQLGERAVQLTYGGGRNLDLYRSLCRQDGVDLQLVDCDVEIRFCHTVLDQRAHTATEIVEPGGRVTSAIEHSILELYGELLPGAHTVIIGGSKAPGFSESLYPSMVGMASSSGKRIVLDVRGNNLLGSIRFRPTVVKINISEFSQTFDPDQSLSEDVVLDAIPSALLNRMIALRRDHSIDVVLTNGSRPVIYLSGLDLNHIAPEQVTPLNAIGSGDAMTAGLAAGLRRGDSLQGAIRLGMECANKNLRIEKPGTIM